MSLERLSGKPYGFHMFLLSPSRKDRQPRLTTQALDPEAVRHAAASVTWAQTRAGAKLRGGSVQASILVLYVFKPRFDVVQ